MKIKLKVSMLTLVALLGGTAQAQDAVSPFDSQWYLSSMASFGWPGESALRTGIGGIAAVGYREGFCAIELSANAGVEKSKGAASDPQLRGGSLNALLFPFTSSGLYANLGVGAQEYTRHPSSGGDREFSTTTAQAGIGYLLPASIGRYRFALRAEGLYRYGRRENAKPTSTQREDIDVSRSLGDSFFNIGLYLPIGLPPAAPPPAPAEPMQTVPVAEPAGAPAAEPATAP